MNDDVYVSYFPFSIVFKSDQNYQNTSETLVEQVHACMNFQKLLMNDDVHVSFLFFDGFQK